MDDFSLFHKREFGNLLPDIKDSNNEKDAKDIINSILDLERLPEERWHFAPKTGQIFAKNYAHPRSTKTRVYGFHATGTGKTSLGHLLSSEFIKIPEANIIVLGFTNTKEVFYNEALKFPELGFVTQGEAKHYRDLINRYTETRDPADRMVANKYYLQLRGRLIHKRKGGRFTFFGYQEFANQLGFYDHHIVYQDIKNKTLTKASKFFLDSLKNSLIIADEFHQCYNKDGFNSRGAAIYFTLEYHKSNVRFMSMSATPFRKSVLESIYLAKILHAGTGSEEPVIGDYFDISNNPVEQPRIKDEAKFKRLFADVISYSPIRDMSLFPQKVWPDKSVYLKGMEDGLFKVIPVKMTKEHIERSKEVRSSSAKFVMELSGEYSRNRSSDLDDKSSVDDIEESERNVEANWIGDMYIPEILKLGPSKFYSELTDYLSDKLRNIDINTSKGLSELAKILPKDAQWISDLPNMYGKIITCHPRIKGGILRLEQILREVGWIGENESPSKITPCAICNVKSSEHKAVNERYKKAPLKLSTGEIIEDHEYVASRYLILHSELDENSKQNIKTQFNADNNINGIYYKMLIGSELIAVGYDNKAIKHICLLSMLDSYELITQFYGRGIRYQSHLGLPRNEWYCIPHNYVMVDSEGWTPERYLIEYPSHLGIKKATQLMKEISFDFALSNVEKRKEAENVLPLDKLGADIETYYMHELYTDEISTLIYIIKKLMLYQSCWKLPDLISAIRDQNLRAKFSDDVIEFYKTASHIRTDIIAEETILFVLENMIYKDATNFTQLARQISKNSTTASLLYVLDEGVKFFMRGETIYVMIWKEPFLMLIPINITSGMLQNRLVDQTNFTRYSISVETLQIKRLLDIENPSINTINDFPKSIHFAAIRYLIEKKDTQSKLFKMYKKYGIIDSSKGNYIYNTNEQVWSYSYGQWIQKNRSLPPYASYVGYFENGQFKIISGKREKVDDMRQMERGAACSTRQFSDIVNIGTQIGIPARDMKNISKRNEICSIIQNKMIEKQLTDNNKTWFMFWGAP